MGCRIAELMGFKSMVHIKCWRKMDWRLAHGKLLQSYITLLVDPYLGKNDVPEQHQRFEAHEKLQTSRIHQNFKIMITHDHSSPHLNRHNGPTAPQWQRSPFFLAVIRLGWMLHARSITQSDGKRMRNQWNRSQNDTDRQTDTNFEIVTNCHMITHCLHGYE